MMAKPAVEPGITDILDRFEGAARPALIPVLQAVQERQGYLSREAVVAIGARLRLP